MGQIRLRRVALAMLEHISLLEGHVLRLEQSQVKIRQLADETSRDVEVLRRQLGITPEETERLVAEYLGERQGN
jgi:hypothetical protein